MKSYRKSYIDAYASMYIRMYGIDICDSDIQIHHIDHNRNNNELDNLVAIPKKLHEDYHRLHFEMKIIDFKIPDVMCGGYVNSNSYNLGISTDYIAVLNECVDWINKRDMVRYAIINEREMKEWLYTEM